MQSFRVSSDLSRMLLKGVRSPAITVRRKNKRRVAHFSVLVYLRDKPKLGVPHFSRVSRSGAVPDPGLAAVEVLNMKICERRTLQARKPRIAQGSGKAPCLEHRETWGTRVQCSSVTDKPERSWLRSFHALGPQTVLRRWRFALHHRQLLSSPAILSRGPTS